MPDPYSSSVLERVDLGEPREFVRIVLMVRERVMRVGEGKVSLATKVVVDDALKGPGLEGYAAAPVMLKNVNRTDASPASR